MNETKKFLFSVLFTNEILCGCPLYPLKPPLSPDSPPGRHKCMLPKRLARNEKGVKNIFLV